ncbi:hypothetical protein ABTD62_20460, partial [Acinetobacter baumannii]
QTTSALFQAPAHPYTRALLGASLSAAHGGQEALHYRRVRLPELRVERRADGTPTAFRAEAPPLRTPAAPPPVGTALVRVEDLHVV